MRKIRFKISLNALRAVLLVLLLVVVSGAAGYFLGSRQVTLGTVFGQPTAVPIDRTVPEGKPPTFVLFWQVWDDLMRLYVDRAHLNQSDLVYGAIKGMVAAAGDPYTAFLTPQENKETNQDLVGSFGGVGIELGFKNSNLAVIAPLSGSPAQGAGIKAGDLILKITDEAKKVDRETGGIALPDAVSFIRGNVGTAVTLTILRDGTQKPFEVRIVRDQIVVKTVEVQMQNQIPVIKVNRFGETTDKEWDSAAQQLLALKEKGSLPGVVLDLRNDPGGYLDQAVNLASDFIRSGVVVWQQDAAGNKDGLSVTRSPRLAGVKLVVLINEGSASAAEILAGALAEKAGATLVGVKSFGKGSVQQPEDLPGGAGLHVTIAKWLLPSQKSIDKVGITPAVEVKADQKDQTDDRQLKKALEIIANG